MQMSQIGMHRVLPCMNQWKVEVCTRYNPEDYSYHWEYEREFATKEEASKYVEDLNAQKLRIGEPGEFDDELPPTVYTKVDGVYKPYKQ